MGLVKEMGTATTRRKGWFVWIALSMSFLNSASNAHGQDEEVTRSTLRGFSGVHVVVQPVAPQIEKEGLTTDQIQKDTEAKIRAAGMKVLSKAEFLKTPGKPYLDVNANIPL